MLYFEFALSKIISECLLPADPQLSVLVHHPTSDACGGGVVVHTVIVKIQ